MPYKNLEITNANSVVQQTDQKNQFYVGFSSVADSQNTKIYDFDLVKQDIINNFNTKKGERVMNPNFGSIIWDLIMEPLTEDTRLALKQDITTICNNDPRVTPTRIDLTEQNSGYILELTLVLNSTNQSQNMKLTFNQKTGLTVQ